MLCVAKCQNMSVNVIFQFALFNESELLNESKHKAVKKWRKSEHTQDALHFTDLGSEPLA